MARRPVFLARSSRTAFVQEIPIEFAWFPGLSVSQKQKSIASLHASAQSRLGAVKILEISSKSPLLWGVQLSAFQLMLPLAGRKVPVEVAFQAAKRFEQAGPFTDLLDLSSRNAKKDPRLKSSGRLIGFSHLAEEWPLIPETAFYDWLYLSALVANPSLAEHLMDFNAFTDIEFNPAKSLNCQARSAALYVALQQHGELDRALSSQAAFLTVCNAASGGMHA